MQEIKNLTVNLGTTHEWLSVVREPDSSNEQLKKNLSLVFEEFVETVHACDFETIRYFIDRFKAASIELFLSEKSIDTDSKVDIKELRDGVADILVTLANVTYDQGLEPGKDYNAVMESNWSKFCMTEEEAIKTVQAYAKGTHPDKLGSQIECVYQKATLLSKDMWVVRRKDGKIMKSLYYKQPQWK